MILRVTVTGEVECHETRSRSESEPEQGAQSVGVDAKPSDLHLARIATTGGIIHLFSLPTGTKMFQFPALALTLKC